MARSIWSGSISFGLVNVPVRLFSAVSHREVRFHMLHERDGGRIRLKRVCELDGEEVPYQEIAKGHELSRGRHVLLTREELEALDPESTRAIDIQDFVELSEIDPIFFEGNYYLLPDRGAARPYALLRDALAKTGKVGIGRMVLRSREHLCAVRATDRVLSLTTLLHAEEVVAQEALEDLPGKERAREREVEMAEQLIASLTTPWEPERYPDTYRERVMELIERKAAGKAVVAPTPEAPRAEVVSLMDALRKSLEAGRGARGGGEEVSGERRHRAQAARSQGGGKKRPSPAKGGAAKKKGGAKVGPRKKTASR